MGSPSRSFRLEYFFAPVDAAWNSFLSPEHLQRLTTQPKWNRHLLDLLRHLLVRGRYPEEVLLQQRDDNKSPKANLTDIFGTPLPPNSTRHAYSLKTLAGAGIAIDYDENRGEIKVNGGIIVLPDVLGIDG